MRRCLAGDALVAQELLMTEFMNYFRLTLLSVIALSACSDAGQEGGGGGGGGDGGGGVADKTSVKTFDEGGKLLDATWGVLDLADEPGPVALVQRDGELFVKGEYREVKLAQGEFLDASLSAREDDTVCAVWRLDSTLSYGCAPSFAVTATYETDGVRHHLSASPDASTVWYQSFSSADALVLQGDTFTQQELFESSVSFFTDSTVFNGEGVGCLRNSRGRAEIYGYFGTTDEPIDRCALSQNGSRLGLLAATDIQAWYGVGTVDDAGATLASLSFPVFGALGLADLDDQAVILRSQDKEFYAVILSNIETKEDFSGKRILTADIAEGKIPEWSGLGTIDKLVAFRDGKNVRALVASRLNGERLIHDFFLPANAFPTAPLGDDSLFDLVDVGSGSVDQVETARDGTTYFVSGGNVFRLGESTSLGSLNFNISHAIMAIDDSQALFSTNDQRRLQTLNGTLRDSENIDHFLSGTVAGVGYISIQDPETLEYCVVPHLRRDEPIGCFRDAIRFLFAGPGDSLEGALVYDEDGQLRQLDGTPVGAPRYTGFSFENRKQGRDGSIWSGPKYTWNGSQWESTGFPHNTWTAFYPVSQTEAWASGGEYALYHYTDGTWTLFETRLPFDRINDLSVSDAGQLLLVTQRKLFLQRL